jgi:transcriptional regulator with XRE-family HTH domain
MTQERFALAFGFSVNTLRHWEQGKRQPEGPARAHLLVIDRDPDAVRMALRAAWGDPAAMAGSAAGADAEPAEDAIQLLAVVGLAEELDQRIVLQPGEAAVVIAAGDHDR